MHQQWRKRSESYLQLLQPVLTFGRLARLAFTALTSDGSAIPLLFVLALELAISGDMLSRVHSPADNPSSFISSPAGRAFFNLGFQAAR